MGRAVRVAIFDACGRRPGAFEFEFVHVCGCGSYTIAAAAICATTRLGSVCRLCKSGGEPQTAAAGVAFYRLLSGMPSDVTLSSITIFSPTYRAYPLMDAMPPTPPPSPPLGAASMLSMSVMSSIPS